MVCCLLVLGGCDTVHEFPDTLPAAEQTVEIRFCFKDKAPLDEYKTISYRQLKSTAQAESYQSRFVVEVYDNGQCLVHKQLFTDVDYDEGISLQLRLATGKDYRIVTWVDKVASGSSTDMHYQTASLNSIELNWDFHQACADHKEAFAGTLDVSLGTASDGKAVVTHTVDLYRPHAKFRIVTTDLDAYNLTGHKPPQKVKLIYLQDLPSLYHFTSSSVTTSSSEVEVWGTVCEFTENTCTLAFDWIFCPGKGITLPVVFEVYDADQKLILRSPQIDIPLMCNKLTTVRDRFLTTRFSDGIGIDDNFEGEISIEL
ncbi:DUF6562 domain-containing protein [Dysgonomonas alginatilytica]|nr:DUF6562 domain-containing protein [Dysgonomonas alginatilytica]